MVDYDIRIGDVYKSGPLYFMVTGFDNWNATDLGRIAYIENLSIDNLHRKDQRTLKHISESCELIQRVNDE